MSERLIINMFWFSVGYDLSPAKEGIYQPPSKDNTKQIRARTLQKFQSIIASAVANNKQMIVELFNEVLNNPLMNSTSAIQYAFDTLQIFNKI